jgi:hypothetical protein
MGQDPGSKTLDPGSGSTTKNFIIFNQKFILSSCKYQILSGMFIPDPNFSSSGSGGQKNAGPGIRNDASKLLLPIAVIIDSKTTFKIVFVF